jgi:hypothetical protein
LKNKIKDETEPGLRKVREVQKIGLITLRKVKHTGNTYYVTLDPTTVASYDLTSGDEVKIGLIEVRKDRTVADETKKEEGSL